MLLCDPNCPCSPHGQDCAWERMLLLAFDRVVCSCPGAAADVSVRETLPGGAWCQLTCQPAARIHAACAAAGWAVHAVWEQGGSVVRQIRNAWQMGSISRGQR